MNPKNINDLKRVITNFLIAIPMAFVLMKIIEDKIEWIFWLFMGILGISGVIANWFLFEEKKSKFLIIIENVALIGAFTLFLWYIATNFLSS